MKRFTMQFALLAAAGVLISGGAAAAEADGISKGKSVFQRVCGHCHGAGPGLDGSKMLPGTAAIAAKYKGAVPPLLEERGDLMADYLKQFVRHGSGPMPMFRKTEISDAELDALATYLRKKGTQ